MSYWHQIDAIQDAAPHRVLEVGVGNGFVSSYLRERGLDVVTLDLNPSLGADVLGSITGIPFADDSFDVVSAFEVLEHLPQRLVAEALREMRRVARERVVVSVPDACRVYPIQITVPLLGVRRALLRLPGTYRGAWDPGGEHCWEIGRGGVSERTVREWMRRADLELERDWRPFQNPLHHFFVLSV